MLAAVLISIMSYMMRYPIKNNNDDIQAYLAKWENQTSGRSNVKLTLVQAVHLGESSTYVALYKVDSNLHKAILEEGLNRNLRILYSGTINSGLAYEGIETSEGQYGVVMGQINNDKVASIKVELQNVSFDYNIKVPHEPYFITATKLPKEIKEETHAGFHFFNKQNQEISLE